MKFQSISTKKTSRGNSCSGPSKRSREMFFWSFLFLLLTNCGSKSPQRQAPPEKFSPVALAEKVETETAFDPKLNVIFVVDNSGSMKKYQDRMAANIKLFADAFFDNTRIDYRIGVMPVYDSKYLNDPKYYPQRGLRKMNPLGELVPLKGLPNTSPSDSQSDPGAPAPTADANLGEGTSPSTLFITRDTPNPKEVLAQTVLLGVQWGPEAEESFSPVLAAMTPEINQNKNQSFYQEDAYLAVIFLTDADDVSPGLSGDDFYQQLVSAKKGDRSKILIAAALPNVMNPSKECTTDGRGPKQAFPALLAASGGIHADLCSDDFGNKLASFGSQIARRVGTQRISLGSLTPDINSIVVKYGPKDAPFDSLSSEYEIKRGPNGYYFFAETNEIEISPYLNLKVNPKWFIRVKVVPASLGNSKNGRLKTI